MGIMDSFKNVFGGKSDSEADATVSPNQTTAAAPEPVEELQQEAVAADSEEPRPAAEQGRKYTVQSGDTLWKIAEEMYGNGSNYTKIFDANSDLLEHPDRIFPGQELVIPDLVD